MFKQSVVTAAIGAALALPGGANAATALKFFENGFNQASDESIEYLIDRDYPATSGGTGSGIVGQLDLGDSLRGILNINTINSPGANIGGATGVDELTAVFQVMVVSKAVIAGVGTVFGFGPDPAFALDICGGQAACAAVNPLAGAFAPGPGAMVVMFSDAANNFDWEFAAGSNDDGTGSPPNPDPADVSVGPYVSEETLVNTATGGSHFWTLGYPAPGSLVAGEGLGFSTFCPAAGGFAGDNVLPAFGLTTGSSTCTNNAALWRLANGNVGLADGVVLGRVPTPFGLSEFAYSGENRGVFDLNTPFETSDNVNVAFYVIPEPTSIALIGASLLGMGIANRRRNRKQAV